MSVEGEFNSSLVVSVSWGRKLCHLLPTFGLSLMIKLKKIYILNRDMESDEKKTWKGKSDKKLCT